MFQRFVCRVLVSTALAVPLVALTTQSVLADRRDFTVRNDSVTDLQELYVSPSSENEWGTDILGRDILPSGQATLVQFDDDSTACRYDIRAIFSDGQPVEDYQVDLCRTNTYTFSDQR